MACKDGRMDGKQQGTDGLTQCKQRPTIVVQVMASDVLAEKRWRVMIDWFLSRE